MGESITSGVLAKWHVADGALVKKDQPLFELETDKITTEGTAESAGKISLKVEAGAEVKIGQVVAQIDDAATGGGDAAPAAPAAAPPPPRLQRPLRPLRPRLPPSAAWRKKPASIPGRSPALARPGA